jgi:hypothetical protein
VIEKDWNVKGVHLSGMCLIPGSTSNAIAVGNDRKVWLVPSNHSVENRYLLS